MSKRIENRCVDCAVPAYPCAGASCPHRNTVVYICDDCGAEEAKYSADSDDLCEYCARTRIEEAFNDLTLLEQARAVDINLNRK